MLTMKKAFSVAIGFAMLGCGDQSAGDVTGPRLSPLPGVSASRGAAKESQMVAGHAEFLSFGIPTAYSNEAKKDSDGAVKGRFEVRQDAAAGDFRISGDIACLTVVGAAARVAGLVSKSTNPDVHPGQYLVWSEVDNDGGPKHAPDLSSDLFLAEQAIAQFHCDNGLTLPPMHAVRGNLEVRTKQGD